MNRPCTQFMMWSHYFFMYEIIRGIRSGELLFTALGTTTTFLSFFYHRSRETRFKNIEPIVAKLTMIYIAISSIIRFVPADTINILLCELACLSMYRYANKYNINHYDLFHPYLHLLISFTSHFYLNLYDKYRIQE